ncbi:hypothetical protein ATE92_0448 [Ulvibacter sp. MAR_2010_11]|nr:hypothetical protein ATE92_0448 [Ulvibacter sp. MAR_2010_11]
MSNRIPAAYSALYINNIFVYLATIMIYFSKKTETFQKNYNIH